MKKSAAYTWTFTVILLSILLSIALSLTKQLFIEVSTVGRSHFVIFNFLQGKVVCLGTCFQVACLVCVYLCRKKIILRLLHEDGIVEAQEQNNLRFNYDSVS